MPGPSGGAYSAPPDLAAFKSGGRYKGRGKGETTGVMTAEGGGQE